MAMESLVLIIPIVLLSELIKKRTDGVKGTFENVGITLTGVVYIGLFGSLLTMIRQRMESRVFSSMIEKSRTLCNYNFRGHLDLRLRGIFCGEPVGQT